MSNARRMEQRNPVLQIKYRSPSELKFKEKNPRKHPETQIADLARCIDQFGFLIPILVDKEDFIVCGEARVRAATLSGKRETPTICISHLDKNEIRAFRLADNKLALNAEWDEFLLGNELNFLTQIHLPIPGFSVPEIDFAISQLPKGETASEEVHLEPDPKKTSISKIGDIWLLGRHKLLCASAVEEKSYETLLKGKLATAVITDPPYNRSARSIGGKGKIKHDEFVEASGEKSEKEFIDFLQKFLTGSVRHLVNGGLIYSFMDWQHSFEMQTAIRDANLKHINTIVWAKTNAGMGDMYRSQTEFVFLVKKGKSSHINNVELGKHGRYRTNLWTYAGVNTFRNGRMDELALHPTVKPVAMIADAIMDCTSHGDIILDPFSGSGTIFLACEKTGRRGYGIDLDPHYVDTAIRRWQEQTGQQAVHAESGQSFSAYERQAEEKNSDTEVRHEKIRRR